MPPRDTAIQLLQLIALTLPAAAIYLDTIYPERRRPHPEMRMDDAEAANFHAVRLTFLWLIFSAIALLAEVLLAPTGYEALLVGVGIVFLGLALGTFMLPIIFNSHGLADKRRIYWPYVNLGHRIKDVLGYPQAPQEPNEDE